MEYRKREKTHFSASKAKIVTYYFSTKIFSNLLAAFYVSLKMLSESKNYFCLFSLQIGDFLVALCLCVKNESLHKPIEFHLHVQVLFLANQTNFYMKGLHEDWYRGTELLGPISFKALGRGLVILVTGYEEVLLKKHTPFKLQVHLKDRNFTYWGIWKGREIRVSLLWPQPEFIKWYSSFWLTSFVVILDVLPWCLLTFFQRFLKQCCTSYVKEVLLLFSIKDIQKGQLSVKVELSTVHS